MLVAQIVTSKFSNFPVSSLIPAIRDQLPLLLLGESCELLQQVKVKQDVKESQHNAAWELEMIWCWHCKVNVKPLIPTWRAGYSLEFQVLKVCSLAHSTLWRWWNLKSWDLVKERSLTDALKESMGSLVLLLSICFSATVRYYDGNFPYYTWCIYCATTVQSNNAQKPLTLV